MRRYPTRVLTALALGCLPALTACSDATGPEFGDVSVVVTGDAVSANRLGDGISLNMGDVPESAVGSLLLNITRIELHLAGGDEEGGTEGAGTEGEGGEGDSWISLDVTLPGPLDILTLSTAGVELAAGTVTAGQYNQVRFFFDTSELVLNEDIAVLGGTVVAGTYDVTVPSADETGLKLQLSGLNVGDGETETVGVQLGVDATIGTLVWNANGFLLSPVLNSN